MSDGPPERYFYHSFPRRSNGEQDEIERGLRILMSMVKSGLLLTPEHDYWQESLSDGTLSDKKPIIQIRACFTELEESKLGDHSEYFGHFALEFAEPTFRQLGAIPVFYIPRPPIENPGLESLGAMMLCRVAEIQGLLNRLAMLEGLVNQTKDKSSCIKIPNQETGALEEIQMTACGAQDLISFLKQKSEPISTLRNSLQGLSGFFYPTENLCYTESLGYYRQREWRIVERMIELQKEQCRKLTNDETNDLLQLDQEFFVKEHNYKDGPARRVDKCRYIEALAGKSFMRHVNRVIVPPEAFEDAVKILEGDGLPSVAVLPPVTELAELQKT